MATKRTSSTRESPPASTKKTKNVSLIESGDSCVSCSKEVEEDGIECQWCCGWEHRQCAGLSISEYKMLGSSSSKIMFFCTLCYTKVPFALKIEHESVSHHNALEKRLKSIEDKLVESLQKYKDCASQLSTNQQDTIMVDINEESDRDSVITLKSPFEQLASSIVKEQNEKEKRHLNLVLHNVPESTKEEANARKQEDINRISSLFTKQLGVKASISNAIRIGKKSKESEENKRPRLLKITVSNNEEKTMILRNKLKLRDQKNPEDVRKIFITIDFTPLEQKKNKQLRDKLKEMNKDGNRYIIKNGKIVQRRSQ